MGMWPAAALDVFETEPLPADSPLRGAPNLVLTPHLGASTAEAQESVGIEIAHSIRAALLEGTIRNAVNMPSLDAKTLAIIGPHLRFGEKLGRFLSQLAPKRVETLNINYSGKVNEVDTTAITRSILKGFLQMAGGSEVNEVNAPGFAETLGLKVSESRLSAPGDYTDMLELSAAGEGKTVSVGGAFFGATPRIVSINSRPVEARPHGVVLVLENTDRPGMVGRIGTLLGDHGVNIATMSLSRNQAGGTALTVLNLDTAPSEELLTRNSRERRHSLGAGDSIVSLRIRAARHAPKPISLPMAPSQSDRTRFIMDFSAHSILWTIRYRSRRRCHREIVDAGKRSRWLHHHDSARHRRRVRWHLDRPPFCGRKLCRRLDHVGRRRDDPVAAVSIAFQARRVAVSSAV